MIEEIIEDINAEIQLQKNRIEEKQKILDLYQTASESLKTKTKIQDLSPTEYITITLVGDDIRYFNNIENDMKILKPLLDKIDEKNYYNLVKILETMYKNINKEKEVAKEINIFLRKLNNKKIQDIEEVIKIMKKYLVKNKNIFIYAIYLFTTIKNNEIKSRILIHSQEIKNIERNINCVIRTLKHDINDLKKQIKQYEDSKKDIQKYKNQKEIIKIESSIKNISNEKIKRQILLYIYNHNIRIQIEQDNKYNYLKKENSKNSYIALLSKYNIEAKEVNLEKIIKISYESIQNILNQLTIFFDNKEIIVKCIENISSIESFNMIINLLKNGIIEKQVLINYPEVLDENSKEHKSLMKNYRHLTFIGINPMMFINSPEAIINNDFLKENLKILKQYNLINYMKNGTNLNYLRNPKLAEKIDISLEIGLENELEKNLEILNNEHLKRLILIKNIGTIPYRIKDIYEILEKNKFEIPDNEIDKYIFNYTMYIQKECEKQNDNSEIPELIEYSEGNSRVYIIDGLLISKNRVKRYYNRNSEDKIEALFQAIIHNTVLTEEEIQRIKSALNKNIKRK